MQKILMIKIFFLLLLSSSIFSQEPDVTKRAEKGCDGEYYLFKEVEFSDPKMTIEKAANLSRTEINNLSIRLRTTDGIIKDVTIPPCDEWKKMKGASSTVFMVNASSGKMLMGVGNAVNKEAYEKELKASLGTNSQGQASSDTQTNNQNVQGNANTEIVFKRHNLVPDSSSEEALCKTELCRGQIDKYSEMKYQTKSAEEILNSTHYSEKTKNSVRAHVSVGNYIQNQNNYNVDSYNELVKELSQNGVSVKGGVLPENTSSKDIKSRISALKSLEPQLKQDANSNVQIDLDKQKLAAQESLNERRASGDEEGTKALEAHAIQKGAEEVIQQNETFSDQANREHLVNDNRYGAEIRTNIMYSDRGQGCSAHINEFHLMHQDTATALDFNITGNYASSKRFERETCRRYTQDDYFQKGLGDQTKSLGSGEQFKIKNICADSAKLYGNNIGNLTGCQVIAQQLMSCAVPSNQIISCPKLYLKNQLAQFEQKSDIEFEKAKAALIEKIIKEHEGLAVTEAALADYLNKYERGQTVAECTTECQTYYRSEANMAGIANGFQGCLAAVTEQDISNTIHHCVAYKEVAKIHFKGNQFESRDGQDNRYESFDGKFKCARSTPFAADYRACKSLVNTYNAAFIGEQALAMGEGVQRSIREANSYERLAAAQAGGEDIQTLGINVVKDSAKTNEVLATQRAAFYTTQVAVLTPMLLNYPSKGNIKRNCKNPELDLDIQLCVNAIDYAEISGSTDQMFFPNKGTRNQFWGELIQAAGKSAVAWIQKGQYRKQQNILAEVQKGITEEEGGGFAVDPSYCQRYPNANECRGSGIRQNVDGFYGGGINVGSVGNNDYSFGNDDIGEYSEGRDLPSPSTAAEIASMLGDSGDKGSNDFNKVSAANLSRGAGGGGGGGGPSGGGGAAGLDGGGGGAQGAGAEGDGSVGITKSNGKYAGTGGTAYTAGTARRLGKDQKVDNPFSSLFGAKNSARDVASQVEDDIAPAKIGLFETISNRYMKVNNDKRLLESNVK